MTKAQTLAALGNQLDSFYSLEQVIKIVESIEVGSSRKITTYDVGRAIDKVIDWMENNERDVFSLGDAEFEISYQNQLECTNVPLDIDNIREALENNFMDFGETEDDVVELERAENEL